MSRYLVNNSCYYLRTNYEVSLMFYNSFHTENRGYTLVFKDIGSRDWNMNITSVSLS